MLVRRALLSTPVSAHLYLINLLASVLVDIIKELGSLEVKLSN
jgi:hypothetical protein